MQTLRLFDHMLNLFDFKRAIFVYSASILFSFRGKFIYIVELNG